MSGEKLTQPSEGSLEVSCDNCVGACCRYATTIMLSEKERSKHRRSMNLKPIVRPKDYGQYAVVPMEKISASGQRTKEQTKIPVPARHGFYIMLETCGHLTEESRCGAYEERPEACRSYEVGSPECLAARAAFGLDGHEAQQPLEIEQPITVRIPRYHQA